MLGMPPYYENVVAWIAGNRLYTPAQAEARFGSALYTITGAFDTNEKPVIPLVKWIDWLNAKAKRDGLPVVIERDGQ